MTPIWIALAVLASGGVASLLAAGRRQAGLRIGLVAAGSGSALGAWGGWCILRGGDAVRFAGAWPLAPGSVRLSIDGLSAWFLLAIGAVGIGTSVYSWDYFREHQVRGPIGAFGALYCALIAAMMLVVCAGDAVLFLAGWELMSLSAFFLVGFHDEDSEARRGAWTFLVATHLGTALGVAPLFAAFVARTGGTSIESFRNAFSAGEPTWCIVLFALGVVGFGTKAGFMPFHVWLPAAHPVAPSPVSALMSGAVIKTGIYGLLRLASWIPDLPVVCAVGLAIVSLVTCVMGILYAVGQRQIKRMLAYSSVENVGIIGLAISMGLLGRALARPELVAAGLTGALLHVLNHALFKGLLFLSAGAVMHDAGTGDMERLGGLARRTPFNAGAFLVGSAAICALPPLNGFVSEFTIFLCMLKGVVQLPGRYAALSAACAAALALTGGLALVVFSKTFSVVFLGARRDSNLAAHATPGFMIAGMALLAAACASVAPGSTVLGNALASARNAMAGLSTADASPPAEALASAVAGVPFASLIGPLCVLTFAGLGLVALRRSMAAAAIIGGSGGTWGCGYASARPTMQYTGSSFVWSVVHGFRHALRPRRRTPGVAAGFASPDRLETTSRDLAYECVYRPVFSGLVRVFGRLRPLQHGRVHLYLGYIVATVVIVFVVEACFAPFAPRFSGNARNPSRASEAPAAWVPSTIANGAVQVR